MRYRILYESTDRMQLRLPAAALTLEQADALKLAMPIAAGAAIAREVADITIQADDLRGLVLLRQISRGLMDRIGHSYRRIMTVNSALILLGFLGVLPLANKA